jgi:hypothetical protein
MQFENRFSKMIRRSQSGILTALLTCAFATVACEDSEFCADGGCADDGGGDPGGDDEEGSGGKSSGGKGSGGKNSGKGSGGLGGSLGSGGNSGMAGGEPGSGGKADGSGGQEAPDPGAIEGRFASDLVDVLPGGSVNAKLLISRKRGFQGTVLVRLMSSDEFTGSQVFAARNEGEVSLTIQADFELEQGYYEMAVIAESSDGALSVEIPLTIRVRGAPGTLDLTYGDREMPWVGEGAQSEAAVDDAGYVYLRNESTVFRFDQYGGLDESFEPEGLGDELGAMIGMEDGVLIGTKGASTRTAVLHIRGTGKKEAGWSGLGQFGGTPMDLTDLPWSLNRREARVAVAADYAYPASKIQLFSSAGIVDNSFIEAHFFTHINPKHARIDSQGRILVAEIQEPGTPMVRLLPNGGLDESFGEAGYLNLAVDEAEIVDFEVLSDDGVAILFRKTYPSTHLAIWTPSSTGGGSMTYHELPNGGWSLLRLEGDRLLVTGFDGDRWPPTLIRLYERTGQPVSSFGTGGAVHLNEMSAVHYAPLPAFERLGWREPAFDSKNNRLIAHGNDLGKLYLFSIWL